ncbi:MAG TPA: DUF389 domain-containing protein, partial [Actinomycetes bacterium]|nr:DUF389 domain-containing protein [Actinomycetes bacterium]
MLHLRLVVPTNVTDDVLSLLEGDAAVTNVVLLPGAARSPAGDVILADVAREGANAVIDCLRGLEVDKTGSIAVENVDVVLSETAREAQRAAPGESADAVVWEEVANRTHDDATLSVTYLLFLTIATMIAAVGVLLDNSILIVGSMVVGPEFGPLAGLCLGIVQRRARFAWRSFLGIVVGFPIAILATVVFAWLLDLWDVVDREQLDAERPLTAFIYQPDALSWVVAFLAGVAGMLSLTSAKSGALVGVLISVTTVPAAANVALGLAYGDVPEARGSLVQLGINLGSIVVAGCLTLIVQQYVWSRR